MTDEDRAAQIVATVKAGHRQFVPHALIHQVDNYHKVIHAEVDVIHTTLANWFTRAGGRVTNVGYDVIADQHYIVFKVM